MSIAHPHPIFIHGGRPQDGGYFSRSWTGELVFRARLDVEMQLGFVSEVVADAAAVDGDGALAVGQVDFLIKRLVQQRDVPHPLPRTLLPEPATILDYSFSEYGSTALFATYADTTRLPWREGDD